LEKKVGLPFMKRTISFLVALAIASTVLANGLGGQRLEKVVGDQIVDIGTDQESTPIAGEPIQFDFNLLKSDTREPLTNTNVTVDIEHNGKTMINSDLIMEPPLTLLVYTFPEGGNYILKTTFYDGNNTLATASFPLSISGSRITTRVLDIAALFVSVLVGLLAGFWVARRRGSEETSAAVAENEKRQTS
jgi:hypothetical protein